MIADRERLALQLIYGTPLPPVFDVPDLTEAQLSVVETLSDAQREALAHVVKVAQIIARLHLLPALQTTAGNIRSLGPAGALDALPEPYKVWLSVVEEAIAKAEGRS